MTELEQLLTKQGAFLYNDNEDSGSVINFAQNQIKYFQYRIAHYRNKHMFAEADILEEQVQQIVDAIEAYTHQQDAL